ncbi:MAG: hypothetical protein J3Q66DRAFT_368032 [Benniella sp.]|nr:MAG: hypothetical protein J3Q66DRAFT_368032 [Benniella sp.]
MSRSGVDDKAVKYIAKALVKAETLRELDLSHNKITAHGIQVLCEALILNRSVTRLCIESNNIKKTGAPYLAGLLAKNCVIRHLNVGSNGLGAEGCSMIADAVRLNGTLNSLSLDMNEMGPMGASAMAAALASNQRLTHLYIPHNNIGDQGLTEICESLKRNNSLISLDVELNQIGHGQSVVGMKALAEVLRTNKHIREINLSYNVFSSEAIQELMKGTADNSTLESIILTNCCITTQGATTIAEVLPTATGLQNLGLTANLDIAEEGYQALATNLSKNRSMKGIQLDYNSEDRHVLYESIQCSLTRNFIWQRAVYTAACRILTLSRIVLLGRPANQKTSQSQRLQRQQPQGGGAWSLLKKVGLGRSSSSNSLGSLLSLGKNRISVDPSSPATSNYEDSGDIHGAETPSVSRKNSRQRAHPSASPPPFPLVQHNHSFDGSHLLVRSSPDQVTEDFNAHKVMANLVNMPHEIFESICAFLDHERLVGVTHDLSRKMSVSGNYGSPESDLHRTRRGREVVGTGTCPLFNVVNGYVGGVRDQDALTERQCPTIRMHQCINADTENGEEDPLLSSSCHAKVLKVPLPAWLSRPLNGLYHDFNVLLSAGYESLRESIPTCGQCLCIESKAEPFDDGVRYMWSGAKIIFAMVMETMNNRTPIPLYDVGQA